jgi:hypothetical protein
MSKGRRNRGIPANDDMAWPFDYVSTKRSERPAYPFVQPIGRWPGPVLMSIAVALASFMTAAIFAWWL